MFPKCPPSCMDICLQLLLLGPKISKQPIPSMRKGFSARALLHLFQGPTSRVVGPPLPLSALCWVPCEGHRGQRWQVSAVHIKDHITHVFRSFPLLSCNAFWNRNLCQPGPPNNSSSPHRFTITANSITLSTDSRVVHSSF